jgi:hypothetical protein
MAEGAISLLEVRCFPGKQASVSLVSLEVVSAVALPLVEQVSPKVYGKLNVALRLGFQHFFATSGTDVVP